MSFSSDFLPSEPVRSPCGRWWRVDIEHDPVRAHLLQLRAQGVPAAMATVWYQRYKDVARPGLWPSEDKLAFHDYAAKKDLFSMKTAEECLEWFFTLPQKYQAMHEDIRDLDPSWAHLLSTLPGDPKRPLWDQLLSLLPGRPPPPSPSALKEEAWCRLEHTLTHTGLRALSWSASAGTAAEVLDERSTYLRAMNSILEETLGQQGPLLGLGGHIDLHLDYELGCAGMAHRVAHTPHAIIHLNPCVTIDVLMHEWFHAVDAVVGPPDTPFASDYCRPEKASSLEPLPIHDVRHSFKALLTSFDEDLLHEANRPPLRHNLRLEVMTRLKDLCPGTHAWLNGEGKAIDVFTLSAQAFQTILDTQDGAILHPLHRHDFLVEHALLRYVRDHTQPLVLWKAHAELWDSVLETSTPLDPQQQNAHKGFVDQWRNYRALPTEVGAYAWARLVATLHHQGQHNTRIYDAGALAPQRTHEAFKTWFSHASFQDLLVPPSLSPKESSLQKSSLLPSTLPRTLKTPLLSRTPSEIEEHPSSPSRTRHETGVRLG